MSPGRKSVGQPGSTAPAIEAVASSFAKVELVASNQECVAHHIRLAPGGDFQPVVLPADIGIVDVGPVFVSGAGAGRVAITEQFGTDETQLGKGATVSNGCRTAEGAAGITLYPGT